MSKPIPLNPAPKGPRIFTHINVDLDAVASVWAAKRFTPKMEHAVAVFVEGNWDGAELGEKDLAVDIPAGGRGLKGETKEGVSVGSCLALIVNKYASAEDQDVLKNLVGFIDIQDSRGSAIKHLAPNIDHDAEQMLTLTGLSGVLRATQYHFRGDDARTAARMGEIFDGMLGIGRERKKQLKEFDNVAEILPGGQVAIITNAKHAGAINTELFRRGVRAIVFIEGMNLGLFRDTHETLRMDAPEIRALVKKSGEENEWFAHPSGFLYCRGSRKAPAANLSKVDPRALANTIASILPNKPSA